MRVHVLNPETVHGRPIGEGLLRAWRRVQRDAAEAVGKSHEAIPTLDDAELVLAPVNESGYGLDLDALRRWPGFPRVARRLVAYSPDDWCWPVLPTLYPACTRFWQRLGWAAPAHYRSDHLPTFAIQGAETEAKDLLFSFIGSACTHPVRGRLLKLQHPEAVLEDVSFGADGKRWWQRSWEDQRPFNEHFRSVLLRSRFVLCPRGVVPASIRLYEAMEAAAVPVIIADELLLPRGPQWETFSLRIKEAEVESIPRRLEALRGEAAAMGLKARTAWAECFAPQKSFDTLVTAAAGLLQGLNAPKHAGLAALSWLLLSLSPDALRERLRFWKRRQREARQQAGAPA